MNAITVKTGCFTPLNLNTNRKYASTLLMIAVFGLSGCVTSKRSLPLAPSPPELRFTSIYHQEPSLEMERYLVEPRTDKKKSLSDEILRAAVDAEIMQMNEQQGFNKKPDDNKLKLCGFKDRFDRKAILAYEWDRSRLALDVDGLSFGGSDDQAIKIEYTLRLQPEKTKQQRCRFNSPWQGIIGSGYNEFFVREEDTVFDELREMRAKLKNYLDQ